MPLTRQLMAAFAVLSVSWSVIAHAQHHDDDSESSVAADAAADNDDGSGDDEASDDQSSDDESSVLTLGSLTSTSFVFREMGGDIVGDDPPFTQDAPFAAEYNYSRAVRFFTDLRLQLTVKRRDGEGWSMRADSRVRVSPGCAFTTNFGLIGNTIDCRTQSGILGGNEYDVRQLYARYKSGKTDLYIGRQFVPELAATKLDGLTFRRDIGTSWQFIGFAGLNPSRISRSVLTDYPAQVQVEELMQGPEELDTGAPILPVAAGMGAAYRSPNVYGSFGAAGIVPMADDREGQAAEPPRVFVTDNGYWQAGSKLDIYHYLVLDVLGAGGFALTNLSLGASYRPTSNITLSGAFNRVDTETLNSVTQTQILAVPDNNLQLPYNYQNVLRVASDSANVGASFALAEKRFEISARAFFRQREELALNLLMNEEPAAEQILPAARSAEVRISVLDRRSVGGMRLGASFSSISPLNRNTPNRSAAQIASLTGSRVFFDDRLEYDVNLTFTSSSDIKQIGDCMEPINCYGKSDVISVQTSNLLYYRIGSNWLGIVNIGVGIQQLTDDNGAQPSNILLSGMLRLAYRF